MLGELSLFDPEPRSANAKARIETISLGLVHKALGPWLTGRSRVADALLTALAQRLKRTKGDLSILVFSVVPGRVEKALVELNEKFGGQKVSC
jgi:CRP/FNR family cyclic AMP-dependent transcriptional regulator